MGVMTSGWGRDLRGRDLPQLIGGHTEVFLSLVVPQQQVEVSQHKVLQS